MLWKPVLPSKILFCTMSFGEEKPSPVHEPLKLMVYSHLPL